MAKATTFLRAVEATTKLKGIPVLGPRLAVKDSIESRKLTLEQFQELRLKAKAAPAQRQHEWRWLKNKARYLLKFELPQGVLTVGILNGEYFIVDGNTRTFGWSINPSMPKPDSVLVVFYDIENVEQMRRVYDAVDSAGSKKTIRNEVVSILREAGVDIEAEFSSDLVLSGALKGVIQAIMGTTAKSALAYGLVDHVNQIRTLDSFELSEKSVQHSAVIAAALTLLKRKTPVDLVKKYVAEFVRLKSGDRFDAMPCVTKIELKATRAFLAMQQKTHSTSSAGAVKAMLPVYLSEFYGVFCSEIIKANMSAKLVRQAASQLKHAV
jgi:hypothetical protein